MPLGKIVSGGQTGVDRAALDVAIATGWRHGGWCPRGRIAEDGVIASHYQLRELQVGGYVQRTRRNVLDSDATLILHSHTLQGGTLATQRFARELHKPCLVLQLARHDRKEELRLLHGWLDSQVLEVLNIAGPRESESPGIYTLAHALLKQLLQDKSVV